MPEDAARVHDEACILLVSQRSPYQHSSCRQVHGIGIPWYYQLPLAPPAIAAPPVYDALAVTWPQGNMDNG